MSDEKKALSDVLKAMRHAADIELGPGEPVKVSSKQLRDMQFDREILALVAAGLTYVEIGRQLDVPLGLVVRRITAMLNGEILMSDEQVNGYLRHQLDLLQIGIESSMRDMEAEGDGTPAMEKVAGTNRHQGRQMLWRFMTHQAALVGLLRQRIDINKREEVTIAVIRGKDYDAL